MIIRTSTLRLSRSNRFRTRKSDNVQIGGSVGAARVVGCGVGSGSLRVESCGEKPVRRVHDLFALAFAAGAQFDDPAVLRRSVVGEELSAVVSHHVPGSQGRVDRCAYEERFGTEVVEGESVVVDYPRVRVRDVLDYQLRLFSEVADGVERHGFAWHDDGAWRLFPCAVVWVRREFGVFGPDVVQAKSHSADVLDSQHTAVGNDLSLVVPLVPVAGERDVDIGIHDTVATVLPRHHGCDESRAGHHGRRESNPIHCFVHAHKSTAGGVSRRI